MVRSRLFQAGLDDKDAEIESITEAYQSIKYDFNQITIYYEKLLEYQK